MQVRKTLNHFFPYVNLLKSANGKENVIRQAKELFNAYGFQTVFGRSDACAITQLSPAAASSLLKKLQSAGVVMPVSGKGKGKYQFRKQSC